MKQPSRLLVLPIGLGVLGLGYFLTRTPTSASVPAGLDDIDEPVLRQQDEPRIIREAVQFPKDGDLQAPVAESQPESNANLGVASGGDGNKVQSQPKTPTKQIPQEPAQKHVQHDGRQELVGGSLILYFGEGPAIEETGPFGNGMRQGYWESFSETGTVVLRGSYRDNLTEGTWEGWFEDGTPSFRGNMLAGKREGEFTYWKPNGEVDATKSGMFLNDVLQVDPNVEPQADPLGEPASEPDPTLDPGQNPK